MNIKILLISDLQNIACQKCIIPRELFPESAVPGVLAKCRVSNGCEYICGIYPMPNQASSDYCWLDNSIKMNVGDQPVSGSLTCIEMIPGNREEAAIVHLTFLINDKLFEIRDNLGQEHLSSIARNLLKPYTLLNNCYIHLNELRRLGIPEIHVTTSTHSAFFISDNTHIHVSDVKLQANDNNYVVRKLEAMESVRGELQELLQRAEICKDLHWQIKPSLNALIIGSSGSGKTSLCMNFIVENNCNSYVVRCSDLLRQYPGEVESEIRRIFHYVKRFARCFAPNNPTVILIEDIDIICTGYRNSSGDTTSPLPISSQLMLLLDELHCSEDLNNVIVLATTSNIEAIDANLRRPGRFGTEICIPLLTEDQRKNIFYSMLKDTYFGQDIEITEDIVQMVADQTHGFVASDFVLLVKTIGQDLMRKECNLKDFAVCIDRSLKTVKPTSNRGSEVVVHKMTEKLDTLGGMAALKKALEISVLAGVRRKADFERFGLCLPKGILLYGPPGCAKTTLARCIAAEANMTFVTASPAEVYSPYVGNAEKFIVKLFDTARKNSPCLLFLDEIDAIVGRRNTQSNDLQSRILSTLLTEMDGISAKLYSSDPGGDSILVVAATNRPDMVDEALMRPGRFDKLIHVPAPDLQSRLNILNIYVRKMPVNWDVDLGALAKVTENFSGADIRNLCNESGLQALCRDPKAENITMADFNHVLKRQRPSLTNSQIQWYIDFEKKNSR